MQWVKENIRHGYPYWQEEATFHICPLYGVMDLTDVTRKYDKDCIYLATVQTSKVRSMPAAFSETILWTKSYSTCCLFPIRKASCSYRDSPPAVGSFIPAKRFPTASAGLCTPKAEFDGRFISDRIFPFSYTRSHDLPQVSWPHG